MGSKLKYIRIEVLVWIIALLLLLLGFSVHYRNSLKQYETHKIFLSDVDGLIVGSPVKFMGVQVGYINKIKIVDDSVYLRFIIKDKNLHLPWGTLATVEFSGMAGARSLELYPPRVDSKEQELDYIKVINPTRLSESARMLYQMYNKFMDICFGMSLFGNKVKSIERPEVSAGSDVSVSIQDANKWIDTTNKKIIEIKDKLDRR